MSYPIQRFSSRRQPLDGAFFSDRLQDAVSYDRIAVVTSLLSQGAARPTNWGGRRWVKGRVREAVVLVCGC